MPVDTGRILDDVTKNLVTLLESQRVAWGVKYVTPFQATFKSVYPCIEVNVTDATFERIESGGGYMCNISADILYCFAQWSDQFAKEELDQRASEIGLFIATHADLGGYAEDVILNSITITALPEQGGGAPIVIAVIRCTVKKEIFLQYH